MTRTIGKVSSDLLDPYPPAVRVRTCRNPNECREAGRQEEEHAVAEGQLYDAKAEENCETAYMHHGLEQRPEVACLGTPISRARLAQHERQDHPALDPKGFAKVVSHDPRCSSRAPSPVAERRTGGIQGRRLPGNSFRAFNPMLG